MQKMNYKGTKYKNKKEDGFDSKKEKERYMELLLLQRAGKISDLKRQCKYELIPTIRGLDGRVVERSICYMADFVYTENGDLIVEDCKGFRTKEYIIKRKLMLWRFGIRIRET